MGSTGVAAIFRDAGDTSQNTDKELQDRARSLLFKETDLEGCSDPAPGSASEIFGSIPDFWEVNVYDCDDGYTLLNALGITRAESGCIMAFSIRAPTEEMPVLTWIADSVRIQVAQGIGPDEENLADLDPETQVMLVGESGRFAVVIPLDMQRDVWFLEGDGDGDGIEEFVVSPQLGYFRDDRLVDPLAPAFPASESGSWTPTFSWDWTMTTLRADCPTFWRRTGYRRTAWNWAPTSCKLVERSENIS